MSHFKWPKNHKNCSKIVDSVYGQTVTRQVQNSNETFWVIFKQCAIAAFIFDMYVIWWVEIHGIREESCFGGKWLFIFNRIMYEGVLYVPSGPCSKLVLLVTGRIRSNFIRAHDAVIITFSRFSRGSSVGQCTRALPRIFLCRTGPINRRKYLHGDHHRWPHQRNCRIRFNGESTLTELYLFAALWNQIENQPKNLQNFVWTLKMPKNLMLSVKQCYQTFKIDLSGNNIWPQV